MASTQFFPADPGRPREALARATHQALCERGYAAPTIQRIDVPDVDPNRMAALRVTARTGATTRRTTADGGEAIPAAREEPRQRIGSPLLTEAAQ